MVFQPVWDRIGAAARAIAAHIAAADPHPQYTTTAEAAAAAPVQSVAGLTGDVVLASTNINDFPEAVDDRVAALLVAGANITLTYNDVANTLTIAASGGGGGGGLTNDQVLSRVSLGF